MSEEKPKTEEKPKEGTADPKAANPAAGGKKKMIFIAVILVVDLVLMAGAAMFIVNRLKPKDTSVEDQKAKEEEELKVHESLTKIGMTLPKPLPFTVNIAGSTPEDTHYLKCALQLEWEAAEHPGEEKKAGGEGGGHGGGGAAAGPTDPLGLAIVERMPKITDIVINILSSQPYADLLKASGKQKLKESIISEVNAILPTNHGHLKNVFFTEFIVQ
jgi:flagellar basal body-associated protein FliL